MKKYTFLICFSFSFIPGFTQNKAGNNLAYAELLGNGLFSSVNFERIIIKYPAIALHAGAGVYPTRNDHLKIYLTIPVGINYLLKFNTHSMLDIGFGVTYTKADVTLYATVDRRTPYINHNYINIVPGVGYRRHTKTNLMFRGSLTPVITHEYGVMPYVGFSFGKIF